MRKLSLSSLDWALEHLQKQSGTDKFPRPFEIDVMERTWTASLRDHLANFEGGRRAGDWPSNGPARRARRWRGGRAAPRSAWGDTSIPWGPYAPRGSAMRCRPSTWVESTGAAISPPGGPKSCPPDTLNRLPFLCIHLPFLTRRSLIGRLCALARAVYDRRTSPSTANSPSR